MGVSGHSQGEDVGRTMSGTAAHGPEEVAVPPGTLVHRFAGALS